jgi:glycosyltransferase involved in cell wall biosynthesis
MARRPAVVRSVGFAVPGALTIPTGGYAYDRRIITELGALGWRVETINLGDGYPQPSAERRSTARTMLAAQPNDRPLVVDGLAFGALPEVAHAIGASHRLIALVHHPLALESGLSSEQAHALRASERQALACTRRVIVTSPFTGRLLASDYDVPPGRIAVVPPGNDRVAPAPRTEDGAASLLAVGAIVARKGYDVLIAALAPLRDLPWRLTIVGDRTRDAQIAARLDADVARLSLKERVAIVGVVSTERLAELYTSADVFVLASRFEGYGMAFAEAIAHGLPIIGTTAGAIDLRARNASVLDAVAAAFARLPSITVVDLACGSGATLRATSARFPSQQSWRLVDNDLSLLARAAQNPVTGRTVITVPIDIARDLEAALDGPVDLVTTSALLDLVSADWLERLATEAAVRHLAVYAALSYDGRVTFEPHHARDAAMVEAVNRHQCGDKGFGQALGPSAAAATIKQFEALRYTVVHGQSDWLLGPRDRDMQSEFVSGWATAAREINALSLADIVDWLTFRRDHITSGRSSIRVGHVDVFARPTGNR